MTRIAVIDDWQGVARSCADWRQLEARADVSFMTRSFPDPAAAAIELADFEILMTMRERTSFPAELITALPRLRMIAITGPKHRTLDMEAAAQRGIVVSNTTFGEGGEVAAAELALGMMLAAARRIPEGDSAIRAGAFQEGVPLGTVLRNRTVGIIGLGRLGKLLASYCKALGMNVLAWSPRLTPERAAEAGVAYASKEELLSSSDVVSLHMVLAPSTVGLIGADDIARMKPGALLINTSRGQLVDEPALIEAVSTSRIMAAIDVFNDEPLPADHPLRKSANTILTPHVGFCVEENFQAFYRQSVENVLAFLDGAPIRLGS